ncbi:N-acetylmannosamine-6-phosphate 2-epimerase [Kribbella sp. VKM Ac-2568]|uniref:N-acetylmannosamine-6-phosphate 2-epimerase n=1 Tax=Kribbella sp. VKM Ac-2568 TaxID=2512219 RepID=UPI001045481D|nr:putative N-acetylmannosamine-6-phosphate 2-epimerase [Kribbella sp. VKM Ac-2568]TCM45607.1 N-acylglucosamine-6-phosphate 2-epimerase [Kribbella sp. VKM Ac-2568]
MPDRAAILDRGCLVVSCQAGPGNPFNAPGPMTLMARAAVAGGAGAIRANGAADVAAIRAVTDLPIIGLNKLGDPAGVFITPTYESAVGIVEAGADLIALDATLRPRPDGLPLELQIKRIHDELGVPVLADCDSLEAGHAARAAGADLVATTLSGYTADVVPDEPDIELIRQLVAEVDCPVVAEGRIRTPEDVRAAFDAGAYAVVVGTAITNPMETTARLVASIPRYSGANSFEGTR